MKLPQVSLRELILLVVIAAMGCGWLIDHRQMLYLLSAAGGDFAEMLRNEQIRTERLTEAIEAKGYEINWDNDDLFKVTIETTTP